MYKNFPKDLSIKTGLEESFYVWPSVTNKNQIWKAVPCVLISVSATDSWPVIHTQFEVQTHFMLNAQNQKNKQKKRSKKFDGFGMSLKKHLIG